MTRILCCLSSCFVRLFGVSEQEVLAIFNVVGFMSCFIMAEGRQQHQANGRLRGSERINSNLSECKKMALELVKSDNPPWLESGKKMGYMQVMQVQWIEKGYGNFALTKENLRDQAARLEKSLGSVVDTVRAGIGQGESVQSGSSLSEGLSHDVIIAEKQNAKFCPH